MQTEFEVPSVKALLRGQCSDSRFLIGLRVIDLDEIDLKTELEREARYFFLRGT